MVVSRLKDRRTALIPCVVIEVGIFYVYTPYYSGVGYCIVYFSQGLTTTSYLIDESAPRFRITVALGVDFLSESAGCDACADRCLPVFLGPSLSHQEKDCKRLLSHGFEILGVNKTPTRKNYCDAKCSNSMHYALNREQWSAKASFWRACSLMPTRNREQGCFWQHLSL